MKLHKLDNSCSPSEKRIPNHSTLGGGPKQTLIQPINYHNSIRKVNSLQILGSRGGSIFSTTPSIHLPSRISLAWASENFRINSYICIIMRKKKKKKWERAFRWPTFELYFSPARAEKTWRENCSWVTSQALEFSTRKFSVRVLFTLFATGRSQACHFYRLGRRES